MLLKRKKKNNLREKNLWELVPIRKFDFEINEEDSLVSILIPKFTNKFLVKTLMSRLKHPFIKVKLDEIGSTIWLEIDGVKTVGEIASVIEIKFRDKVQPVEERFQKFFSQLYHHKFINFESKEVKV